MGNHPPIEPNENSWGDFMISKYFNSRILVLAAVGAMLAGCDSVKDVRQDPSTALPTPTVVLQGTVSGVSSKRPVLLMNNGQASNFVAVTAPSPSEANEELLGVTPFTFGTLPAGSAYNITVLENPIGKNCVVASGGSGTLEAGVTTNVVVNCTNIPGTRYSLTVSTPLAFRSAAGAQVVLTTEEAIYRINPGPNDPSVTFTDVLFNPNPPSGPPSPQVFNWNVIASNTIGGTLNKCVVTNATNPTAGTPPVAQSPTGNITNVAVGACTVTIGGTVSYSPRLINGVPAATPSTPPSGLVLELRDIGENTVRTQAFTGAWGAAFTFNQSPSTPVEFVSNRNAVYTVAVNTHPAGMHCVVANPTAILYAPTLTSNPSPITSPSIQCRELPAANAQLRGVYRHVTTSWKKVATDAQGPNQVVTYDALNFTKQNTASSNMMAFFENGTYIYGTHANSAQVEHGFYDYDPTAQTLRLTLNADTNPIAIFPSTFTLANTITPAAATTTTPGLSAVPGATVVGGVRQPLLTGVNVNTPGRITGTFRGSQALGIPNPTPATTPTETVSDASMGWVLQAPPSITGQMTGAWLAQDSRRLWVFDKETYYGTHVGVVGVFAMNDACFTMPDVSVSSGLYTRRPSINGCYPWPRPQTGQSPAYALSGLVESVDFKFPQFIPTSATSAAGGAIDIGTLPPYMARIPGGAQAVDGRSPSPIYFHIAPAAQFYSAAPAEYFPTESTTWCTTEILGIRSTLNAVPIHKPVYFCRFVP
jgi:hypothetical protein